MPGPLMSIKNRKRLNALMQEQHLSSTHIGELLGRHPQHVRAWMCGVYPMPDNMLRLLELELKERAAQEAPASRTAIAAQS